MAAECAIPVEIGPPRIWTAWLRPSSIASAETLSTLRTTRLQGVAEPEVSEQCVSIAKRPLPVAAEPQFNAADSLCSTQRTVAISGPPSSVW